VCEIGWPPEYNVEDVFGQGEATSFVVRTPVVGAGNQ